MKRNFIVHACACIMLPAFGAVAQQNFDNVQITATKVAGTVYMLQGSGGNIGVCTGEDGIIIVDDQYAPLAPKIKAALKNISDKPLKFVLNTHFHGDHTGGNAQFGTDAPIIAHENVRERLKTGTPVAPKEALPVVTFNERASVHVNGEDIKLIHFPNAHTDGDSVIYFTQSKVVHMGDTFVTYGFPYIDTRSGGSVSGMISAVEKALAMLPADVKIIPGHGPLCTPDDARKFVALMKDTRALVADAVKAGKTPAQMKADKILAKYDEQYGRGSIKTDAWIDVCYADVTSKKNPESAHFLPQGRANEVVR